MNPDQIALGRVIRAAIADADLTITEAAKRTGIPRSAVYNYLDGSRAIPVSTLARIGSALGVPGWELMRRAYTGRAE